MSSLKRLTLLQKREIIEIANKPGFNSKSRQKIAQDYILGCPKHTLISQIWLLVGMVVGMGTLRNVMKFEVTGLRNGRAIRGQSLLSKLY